MGFSSPSEVPSGIIEALDNHIYKVTLKKGSPTWDPTANEIKITFDSNKNATNDTKKNPVPNLGGSFIFRLYIQTTEIQPKTVKFENFRGGIIVWNTEDKNVPSLNEAESMYIIEFEWVPFLKKFIGTLIARSYIK